LNYAIPYGVLGRLSNTVFVGKQIEKIFKYRQKAIREMFGELS